MGKKIRVGPKIGEYIFPFGFRRLYFSANSANGKHLLQFTQVPMRVFKCGKSFLKNSIVVLQLRHFIAYRWNSFCGRWFSLINRRQIVQEPAVIFTSGESSRSTLHHRAKWLRIPWF